MVRFNFNFSGCALIRVAACIIVARMSATTVTVLCPNGRRVNIRPLRRPSCFRYHGYAAGRFVDSGAFLQVLEQVCSKQKLDPAYHVLK